MSKDTALSHCQIPGDLLSPPVKQADDTEPQGGGTHEARAHRPLSLVAVSVLPVIMRVTGDFQGPVAKVSVMWFQ